MNAMYLVPYKGDHPIFIIFLCCLTCTIPFFSMLITDWKKNREKKKIDQIIRLIKQGKYKFKKNK